MATAPPRVKTLVVAVALAVGLLHFVTGPNYHGPLRVFVNGYLIDILLPLARLGAVPGEG